KQKHFIKNIEIKNFKCFNDFKAEGFGRVNLIGGKNNVGKTAFMEACFLIQNSYKFTEPENREKFYLEIIKWLIILEENRKTVDFLIEWIKDDFELINFARFEISIPNKFHLTFNDKHVIPENKNKWNYGAADLSKYRENKFFYTIYKKNNPPQIYNTTFISPCSTNHGNLKEMIDSLKINNQYEYINSLLEEIFNIERIDIIKNKVMLQQNKNFKDLNDFGNGVKNFLNIILCLLVNKEAVVYLDEIENGIHYSLLDKLWEIILTISKKQNVQVFATTHSKECIESYARVAKRLEDEEITMVMLARNPNNELKALVYDDKMFYSELEQDHEVRGW
ncbi:MAG: AAA family ATPase, partial [Sulfurovum sp.]|nr:AAA family ATPase [Sulfurovum sp.]